MSWRTAVFDAVRRVHERRPAGVISRDELIRHELPQIVADTHSRGLTPEQTLSRVLQELRDEGILEFLDNEGHYRLMGEPFVEV